MHLVTRGRVAGELSEAARHHLARTFDRLDVVVHENVEVTAVERDGLLAAQGRLRFDLCVWTAGFAFPSLPGTGGLAVNARGQVLVDPQLRSISYPHVYAAGDIAAPVLDPGQALPLGCKTAQPTGAHVADTLVAEMTQRALPPFDYALPFYCASLGRRDGLLAAQGRLRFDLSVWTGG